MHSTSKVTLLPPCPHLGSATEFRQRVLKLSPRSFGGRFLSHLLLNKVHSTPRAEAAFPKFLYVENCFSCSLDVEEQSGYKENP